jgi:hypothetical protein
LQIAAPAIVGHFLATVRHGPGGHARGVTFLTLASRQLAHALALRPRRDGRNVHGLLARRPIEIGVAVSFALLAAPFLIPPLRRLLRIERPLLSETVLALGLSLLPFVRREMQEHAGPRASRGRESRDAVGPTQAG